MKKEEYEEFHQKHIQLWDWLAQTGERWKSKAPYWEQWGEMLNDCFACEIHSMLERKNKRCDNQCIKFCPMDTIIICGEKQEGIYWVWDTAEDKEKRMKFAAQIRDLPWKSYEEIMGEANGKKSSNIQPD